MRSKRSSKNCMSAKAWEQGLRLLLFTICAIVKFNDESKRILRRAVTSCKASCASNFCWKRVSNTAGRFGLQAFPSICRDAFASFISARIRWRLSAKNRPRDESRCLNVSPPLEGQSTVSNENSMRITVATGNEFCEVFKALCKRNRKNRIVVFQQGSFTVYCFDR